MACGRCIPGRLCQHHRVLLRQRMGRYRRRHFLRKCLDCGVSLPRASRGAFTYCPPCGIRHLRASWRSARKRCDDAREAEERREAWRLAQARCRARRKYELEKILAIRTVGEMAHGVIEVRPTEREDRWHVPGLQLAYAVQSEGIYTPPRALGTSNLYGKPWRLPDGRIDTSKERHHVEREMWRLMRVRSNGQEDEI